MKALDINELNRIYDDAETVDKDVFAECRSNVLLLAGEHYKKADQNTPRTGSATANTDTVKLRLVKNHIHKIVRHYVTSILSYAPGVQCAPFNETDLQDQKDAELNQAVLEAAKSEHRTDEKVRKWCTDFVGVGEVAVKIFWDPNAGELEGYEQAVDEKTGEPLFDMGPVDPMTGMPTQVPVPDEDKPVFKGKFVFESIFAGNLLRHAAAKEMRAAQCWIIRKMVRTSDLKSRYKDDPKKLKGIEESSKDEFVVFDSSRSSYDKQKGESLVREFYWPKCTDYPEGYFAITSGSVILEEGPLPFGVLPIAWAGFDELPTSPRGRSIIKVARPYVAEINRASSAMAMHQVTIGDDKIIYQSGTKLAPGSLLPGVRGITYQGREPTILPGRDGGQYLNYIQAQIAEMYSVLMLEDIEIEKNQNIDVYALLYRSSKQQQKFSMYSEKFEQFLIDVWTIYLELAKQYLPDDCLIPSIGKSEMVNLSEFRSTSPFRYQVKLLPRSDTLETMLGKQLTIQNTLQYAGKQLSRDDVGKLMKESPFGNAKEIFSDMTLNWEIAKNEMLALDRGQWPRQNKHDDVDYLLQKLSARTRRPDFQFLDPRVQQIYEQRMSMYEQLKAQQKAEELAQTADYIPTDGAMVKAQMYVTDPQNPQAPAKLVEYPTRALEWLSKRLQDQGGMIQAANAQSPGVVQGVEQQLQMLNAQQAGGSGQIQPTIESGPAGQMVG